MKHGADDYLTKPFNHEVLLARTEAVLRRSKLSAEIGSRSTYVDNFLTIDLNERRVLVQGEMVRLTATEYRLLTYLVENANRVLTFRQILTNVWGQEFQYNAEYVHVYISNLRSKLEKDPRNPLYLLTEYGIGYRFETTPPGQTAG